MLVLNINQLSGYFIMSRIIRITLYLSILAFYNLTTFYTAVVHNHQFSWTEDDSCSAYIISLTQNSDTFPFSLNHNIKSFNQGIYNFQSCDSYLSFEIKNIFSARAPPAFM